MGELRSNTPAASGTDDECDKTVDRDAERKRLIDDIAFLVVREHRRRQNARSDNASATERDPTDAD